MNTEKRVYSIQEVTTMLGVSRGTVYNMFDRGELRPVKIGRRRLIPVEQVETLLTPAPAGPETRVQGVEQTATIEAELPETVAEWLATLAKSE